MPGYVVRGLHPYADGGDEYEDQLTPHHHQGSEDKSPIAQKTAMGPACGEPSLFVVDRLLQLIGFTPEDDCWHSRRTSVPEESDRVRQRVLP